VAACDVRDQDHDRLRILAAGHALVQNLRRGHYEIAADQPTRTRLAAAFSQLATAI
jgi:hypothetical protein